MFNSVSKKIGAFALAATVALPMMFAAGQAEAKHGRNAALIGGLIGGAVLGSLLTGGTAYGSGGYYDDDYAPVRRCWRERQVVGYDSWGDAIIRRVRVCN